MSDCAEPPGLLDAGLDLHVRRDPTRGDLAGALIGRLAAGPAGQGRVRTPFVRRVPPASAGRREVAEDPPTRDRCGVGKTKDLLVAAPRLIIPVKRVQP